MVKLTPEIKDFIDAEIKSKKPLNYRKLSLIIAEKYGVKISKATISKRAKALKIQFRRGRKRIIPIEKRPAHSIFLDCAGAFFLKGAELEMGLLPVMNQLLKTSTESTKAQKTLKLAQQINAILLYSSIFNLNTAREITGYKRKGLLYLTEQKGVPGQEEIEQYLHFLVGNKLLASIFKEVTKICPEALFVRIDFAVRQTHYPSNRPERSRRAGQTFYLDAQSHTVWPTPEIPRHFSATINKVKGYVKDIFQSPSTQRPLILQTCPGYTFLPKEMFNLIQCFEQAQKETISRIVIADKSREVLNLWRDVKPAQKCFFIAPLSPWQYAKLQGTRIVKDFSAPYLIGPEKEPMAVAEAKINLFNSQLNENIRVRAALIRRKEERLALITNISRREERYIRKIAEQYFCRWPDKKLKTYYDLLEEAHQEELERSQRSNYTTSLLTITYGRSPLDGFKLLLEQLNRYALNHFFPSEYGRENLKSMCEKFYKQGGYLKIKGNCREITLRPFLQKKLQEDAKESCRRFNQMSIKFPDQKRLYILLQ